MPKKELHIESKVLHAGHTPDSQTLSRAVPIYQTTSYVFKDTQHAADLFALRDTSGFIYTRIGNPTTDVLERRLAAIHDGTAAICTASGMSAVFYAVAAITGVGQNIVSGSNLYGGTHVLFENTLKRFGIEVRFVDTSTPAKVEAAIDAKTRLVFTESIGNPKCNVDDMQALADVAHRHQIPFVVDNTVSPPPIFNPFEHGCDIAVYSLTKIIGGHGNSIGGAVVEAGGFDWAKAGKFPEITAPDPSYHGLNFWEALCTLEGRPCTAFCVKLRTGLMRDIGAALAPMNSFLILQGLETLPLRATAHCENARKVAAFLEKHPFVKWVNYAGLKSHPDYARSQKYFPMGAQRGVRFRPQGRAGGRQEVHRGRQALLAPREHPGRPHPGDPPGHHDPLPAAARRAARRPGVEPEMVRISVGIEHADDIIADLDQALKAAHP